MLKVRRSLLAKSLDKSKSQSLDQSVETEGEEGEENEEEDAEKAEEKMEEKETKASRRDSSMLAQWSTKTDQFIEIAHRETWVNRYCSEEMTLLLRERRYQRGITSLCSLLEELTDSLVHASRDSNLHVVTTADGGGGGGGGGGREEEILNRRFVYLLVRNSSPVCRQSSSSYDTCP